MIFLKHASMLKKDNDGHNNGRHCFKLNFNHNWGRVTKTLLCKRENTLAPLLWARVFYTITYTCHTGIDNLSNICVTLYCITFKTVNELFEKYSVQW